MAQKLRDENFEGLLRLMHGGDWGLVIFADGEPALSLYSEGWEGIPIDQRWQRWVAEHPVRAQVEKKTVRPPADWFRHAFTNLEFDVQAVDEPKSKRKSGDGGTTSSRLRQFLSSTRSGPLAATKLATRLAAGSEIEPFPGSNILYDQAPGVRLLQWIFERLPRYFAERDLADELEIPRCLAFARPTRAPLPLSRKAGIQRVGLLRPGHRGRKWQDPAPRRPPGQGDTAEPGCFPPESGQRQDGPDQDRRYRRRLSDLTPFRR